MKILLLLVIPFLTDSSWAKGSSSLCQLLGGSTQITATVRNISDGDTLSAYVTVGDKNFKVSVRLKGIDAPETSYQGKSQGYWGDQSTNSLKSMISINQRVLLEFDSEPCDYYGRLVATVRTSKYDVNREQIKRGLAATYCYKDVTSMCIEYAAVMKEAVDRKKGMHQDRSLLMPYMFRYTINNMARSQWVMNLETLEYFNFEEIHKIPPHLRVFIP